MILCNYAFCDFLHWYYLSDIVTEDLVTAWLGDRVELLCNLSLQDDTVAWYHDDRRLASDGSGGYVFDPSGPILQFQALSASYQGWYVCTSRENRRHSTQLIIRGRKDLNGGVCECAVCDV